MKKYFILKMLCIFIALLITSCSQGQNETTGLTDETGSILTIEERSVPVLAGDGIVDLSEKQTLSKGINERHKFKPCLVKLSGRVNHFGYDITTVPPSPIPFEKNVSDVKVWIAEYPFTKYLNIKTNSKGIWTIWLIKFRGIDLNFSYIYEKEGWITTKSNIIPVTDEDNTDIAIQFIDPVYYYYAIKPGIESQLSAYLGFPVTLANAVVATVGKSWASMHNPTLPHGDPGATMVLNPLVPAIGPIYFNEYVQPDPAYTSTSVDGGVVWINMPLGNYEITAVKEPYEYDTVKFNITESDVENNVVLYIASPPDSIEGTNDSGPGEY